MISPSLGYDKKSLKNNSLVNLLTMRRLFHKEPQRFFTELHKDHTITKNNQSVLLLFNIQPIVTTKSQNPN